MCRFVAYKGDPIRVSDLIIRPEHSLVRQSLHAKQRREPVNGDGFGLGWYSGSDDQKPGIYSSIEPAWSNRNLEQLSEKIVSPCFFAHIRDATPGMPVTQLNCHPFGRGPYLWMHNGAIAGYRKHRRHLFSLLSDTAFNLVEGNTDSEFMFALFCDYVNFNPAADQATLEAAFAETLNRIQQELTALGETQPSRLNCAITNGTITLASRVVVGDVAAESLYVSNCQLVEGVAGRAVEPACGAIIASEPLNEFYEDWQEVPPGALVSISADCNIQIRNFS